MAEDSPSSILDLSPCSTNPANSFPPRRHRPKMHTQQAIPVPRALNLDDNELQLLATVMTEPPVTRETLEELNLDHIMNNINLRADVNFDDELHFRPNTETKKGQQKRRQGELYWQALAVEIKVYQYLAVARCMNTGGNMDQESIMAFRPRLPTMFTRLKDLSKTLVPDRDHEEVEERLDVSLLMQQVERGVLDIIGLSQWLCSLLKNHCAPMRDPEADKIVERMVEGCKVQNTRIIGEGLRYAFAMLEIMKLDVANHQIRTFKILLIDDTVPFMQSYFLDRIRQGQFDIEPSRRWYERAMHLRALRQPLPAGDDSFWLLSALLYGLLEPLITSPHQKRYRFEENLRFDEYRLWKLQSDTQDLIYLDICCYIFGDLVNCLRGNILTPSKNPPISPSTYEQLTYRITAILRHSRKSSGSNKDLDWHGQRDNIALEITRTAYLVSNNPLPLSEQHLSYTTAALAHCMRHDASLYRRFQEHMVAKLDDLTLKYARIFLPMGPLEINAWQSQRTTHSEGTDAGPQDGYQSRTLNDIACRLAHIGVLHWRIWAPILYDRQVEGSRRADGSMQEDGASEVDNAGSDVEAANHHRREGRMSPTYGGGGMEIVEGVEQPSDVRCE